MSVRRRHRAGVQRDLLDEHGGNKAGERAGPESRSTELWAAARDIAASPRRTGQLLSAGSRRSASSLTRTVTMTIDTSSPR